MPQTQIADVIVPAEFTAYQIENSLVSTALFQSGVAIRNGEMESQLQAGAQSFTVPFWSDLGDVEADITNDVRRSSQRLRRLPQQSKLSASPSSIKAGVRCRWRPN